MKTTRKGYLEQRGRTFYAVWYINGKKYRRSTHETTERKAQAELNRMMTPFMVGNDLRVLESVKARIEGAQTELDAIEDEQNPPLGFKRAWDAFLSSQARPESGDRTLREYESHFDQFADWVRDTHKDVVALRDVTPAIAGEYAAHLSARGLSGNRFNKHVSFLRMFYRVLQDSARIKVNPWERITRKRQIANSRRELTVEELRAVCERAEGELRLLLAIGIYTGLRLGDAATLRWGEVDTARGIIRRIPNKTASRNPRPILIPIHPSLLAMLTEAPRGRGDYVLPKTAATIKADPVALTRDIQGHFKACGIQTHRPGTGGDTGKRAVLEVGFHSLRHSFVSLCRAKDIPLSVVEAIVGHSNPAMTRHYTHTGEAAAVAAVAALPSISGEAIAETTPAPARALVDAGEVREIAEGMTAKTWRDGRDKLLRITDFPPAASDSRGQ